MVTIVRTEIVYKFENGVSVTWCLHPTGRVVPLRDPSVPDRYYDITYEELKLNPTYKPDRPLARDLV